MCEHCDTIRQAAETVLFVSFQYWNRNDTLHAISVMYALFARSAIDNGWEKEFKEHWNKLIDEEINNINELNPIEPKQFDETYDFRKEFTIDPEDHR